MQKRTSDYDNVFKTMKSKHKRLFISVINDIFWKNYLKTMQDRIGLSLEQASAYLKQYGKSLV